jgi:hypothetical protein
VAGARPPSSSKKRCAAKAPVAHLFALRLAPRKPRQQPSPAFLAKEVDGRAQKVLRVAVSSGATGSDNAARRAGDARPVSSTVPGRRETPLPGGVDPSAACRIERFVVAPGRQPLFWAGFTRCSGELPAHAAHPIPLVAESVPGWLTCDQSDRRRIGRDVRFSCYDSGAPCSSWRSYSAWS